MTRKRFSKLMRFWFYQHSYCYKTKGSMGQAYKASKSEGFKITPEFAAQGMNYQDIWEKLSKY